MGLELDKSLRDGLLLYFRYRQPDIILRNFANKNNLTRPLYRTPHATLQYDLPKLYAKRYSINDALQFSGIIKANYMLDNDQNANGVFGMMLSFAKQALTQRNNAPSIRYEQILRWRDTTHPLGTLPFICAYLADCDRKNNFQRSSFSINPTLPTNNVQLNSMLAKGMAENHFHLKGSAQSFLLSWVCLMNDVTNRQAEFDTLKQTMLREELQNPEVTGRTLRVLVFQAAAIRAELFIRLMAPEYGTPGDNELRDFRSIMGVEERIEAETMVRQVHATIESLRALAGALLNKPPLLDYAFNQRTATEAEKAFDVFAGEARFLYCMFYAFFTRDKKIMPYIDLFYAYLLISMRFRAELIQSNRLFGFSNFKKYDSRKGIFIQGRKPYNDLQGSMAAIQVLTDKRYYSLEARIVPMEYASQIHKQVTSLDGLIKKGFQDEITLEKLMYVLHIPKRPDSLKDSDPMLYTYCRDDDLRKKVQRITKALINLRRNGARTARRIRGIDACSNEADARPEVFASEFRRLKSLPSTYCLLDLKPVHSLHVTYHVGEDFPDVVDGLRAIWEAVEFIELGQGDRIGHGLALGIDAIDWYAQKQNRIFITRQALLDNCAWMLEMLRQYNVIDIQLNKELESVCAAQYTAIYQQTPATIHAQNSFNLTTYFCAMQLRGDNPYAYNNLKTHEIFKQNMDSLKNKDSFALRNDEMQSDCYLTRRYNERAIRLYQQYHYNPTVKRMGREIVEYHIPNGYANAAARLQCALRHWVARKGIGLESNPSSNVLIGNFNRYDKHPLVAFHDSGLFDSPDNPHMFVSINTDDQGVFDTSLENEYALMARGLEQLENPDGSHPLTGHKIYQWLNRIREMGIEQSFFNQ